MNAAPTATKTATTTHPILFLTASPVNTGCGADGEAVEAVGDTALVRVPLPAATVPAADDDGSITVCEVDVTVTVSGAMLVYVVTVSVSIFVDGYAGGVTVVT